MNSEIFFMSGLPEWARFLVQGILLFALMACSAVILGRAGRSPYWALLVIVPVAGMAAICAFAFCRWPRLDGKGE